MRRANRIAFPERSDHPSPLANRLFDFVRRLVLYARQKFAAHAEVPTCINFADKSMFSFGKEYPSGWYMVELCTVQSATRVRATILIKEGGHERRATLPVFSGRPCKRLVYLPQAAQVFLTLPTSHFEIKHFRLAVVSRKFARSRITQRLRSGHPRYMAGAPGDPLSHHVGASRTASLSVLWLDYCRLFEDEEQELVCYRDWVRDFDTLSEAARVALRSKSQRLKSKPLISIRLSTDAQRSGELGRTIESIISQAYSNWELWIDQDRLSVVAKNSISSFSDSRIIISDAPPLKSVPSPNGHTALARASDEWLVFIKCGDVISSDAFFHIACVINENQQILAIYSDEDFLDDENSRRTPHFKSNWDRYLFYSSNYIPSFFACHADLAHQARRFENEFHELWLYELVLRCTEIIKPDQIFHIQKILCHRHFCASENQLSATDNPCNYEIGRTILTEHFARIDVKVQIKSTGKSHRIVFNVPEKQPSVQLVIPTRNGVSHLRKCIGSILDKTDYQYYEILVIDNGSDQAETLEYLRGIEAEPRVRVIRDDSPFNYSALNNRAISLTDSEIVGLINDDVEVIHPEWLSEMVSYAIRPDIGVVGAKLLYPDDTIQHAGIVLGIYGVAGHVHRFLPRHSAGYFGRAQSVRSVSAVTGACAIVRRSVYEEVGGLNETELQIACNDVDLCLRVVDAGYINIWTPYAELYHHESVSRGFDISPEKIARSEREIEYMKKRWGSRLNEDPAYNPNLGLYDENSRIAWPPRSI